MKWIIFPLLVLAGNLAYAQTGEVPSLASERIEATMNACLDEPGNVTTAGSIGCLETGYQAFLDSMDVVLLDLKDVLPESVWFSVLASQEQWHAYRVQEEETARAIYGSIPGSMSRIYVASRRMEIAKVRLIELEFYRSDWQDLYWEED